MRVRANALGPLGGIQPVTRAMATAAEGPLLNLPSDGEIDLFRNAGTKFQMVSGCRQRGAFQNARQRAPEAIPYALTLIPASKRGSVDERGIDVIAKLTSRRLARKTSLAMRGWILFLVNGGSLAHSQY
jgi:hypothetical protein